MEINSNQQAAIDRYLRGELKGSDLDNFLKQLENNPAMATALDTQEKMAQGIEHYGNRQLRKRLQNISAKVKSDQSASDTKSRKSNFRMLWMGMAAAIALLLVAYFLWPQANTNQLLTEYYEPAAFSISREGDNSEALARAERFYNTQQYEAAIPVLQKLLEAQPEASNLQLALGNAQFNSNNPVQAVATFQDIIDQKNPLFSDQAKWYLALTHLKLEQIEVCKNLLRELANDSEADFHQQAIDLMGRL